MPGFSEPREMGKGRTGRGREGDEKGVVESGTGARLGLGCNLYCTHLPITSLVLMGISRWCFAPGSTDIPSPLLSILFPASSYHIIYNE